MRIVLFGNGNMAKHVINALLNREILVHAVFQDKPLLPEEQQALASFLLERNIALHDSESRIIPDCDLVFVVNYNRIINLEMLAGKPAVNLHMGILPRYRGNNANAWAVMNGESEVGFTLHKVSGLLDAGEIYYTYRYPLTPSATYADARAAMDMDIQENLARILHAIYDGSLRGIPQGDAAFIYCTRLRPSDGLISGWNHPSDFFVRKQFVFGRPLGTGLYFMKNGIRYNVGNIEKIEGFASSIGIPGAITLIRDGALWVKTEDTAVRLSQITVNGLSLDPGSAFRIGNRL